MSNAVTLVLVLVAVVVVYEVALKPTAPTSGLFGNINLGSAISGWFSGGNQGRTSIPNSSPPGNSSDTSSSTSTGDFFS